MDLGERAMGAGPRHERNDRVPYCIFDVGDVLIAQLVNAVAEPVCEQKLAMEHMLRDRLNSKLLGESDRAIDIVNDGTNAGGEVEAPLLEESISDIKENCARSQTPDVQANVNAPPTASSACRPTE